MLDESPHILYRRVLSETTNKYGDVTEDAENWVRVGVCFCHDNSQMQQVTVNGKLWTYSYHVVYEGGKIPLGTEVKCISSDCHCANPEPVGYGEVIKNAECYSEDLRGRCDLWLG